MTPHSNVYSCSVRHYLYDHPVDAKEFGGRGWWGRNDGLMMTTDHKMVDAHTRNITNAHTRGHTRTN